MSTFTHALLLVGGLGLATEVEPPAVALIEPPTVGALVGALAAGWLGAAFEFTPLTVVRKGEPEYGCLVCAWAVAPKARTMALAMTTVRFMKLSLK
jgi:hypothetical protein